MAFMDRALVSLSRLLRDAYVQWDLGDRDGLLQRADPRLKLILLVSTVVLVSFKQSLWGQLVVGISVLVLAALSKIPLGSMYGKVILFTGIFGVILPLPICLNVMVPGELILPLFGLDEPREFLWFRIPQIVGISKDGLMRIGLLSLRVLNSLSATFLVLYTTQMAQLVRSLKHFRLPDTILVVVLLTYRYLFIFVSLVEQMHRARWARLIIGTTASEGRIWAAERIASLFQRAQARCEEMYMAMESRGFSGRLHVEPLEKFGPRHWAGLGILAFMTCVLALI